MYSILWSRVAGQIHVAGSQQKLCNGDRTINLELDFLVSLCVSVALHCDAMCSNVAPLALSMTELIF